MADPSDWNISARVAWCDALLRAYVVPQQSIRARREAGVWTRWQADATAAERVVLEAAIRAVRPAPLPIADADRIDARRVESVMPPGLAEALAAAEAAGPALPPDRAPQAVEWISTAFTILRSVSAPAQTWLARWTEEAWATGASRLDATSAFAWAVAAAAAGRHLVATEDVTAELEVMRRLVAAQTAVVTMEDGTMVCRNLRGRGALPSPMRHPLWGDTHGILTSPDRAELLSDDDLGAYDLRVPVERVVSESERGVEIALAGIARGETVDQQAEARRRLTTQRGVASRRGEGRERGPTDPLLPLAVLAIYDRGEGGRAFSGDAFLMSAHVPLDTQRTIPA